jgi:hypothetical protein
MVSGHQDVVRLDVAMNDALAVRVSQCVHDIAQDAHDLIDRQLVMTSQSRPEGLPRDIRHRVVQQPSLGARRQKRYDVRVLESRRELDFALEPFGTQSRCKFGRENLDDDLSIKCQFMNQEDARHPSATQLPLDAERLAEDALQPIL